MKGKTKGRHHRQSGPGRYICTATGSILSRHTRSRVEDYLLANVYSMCTLKNKGWLGATQR